MICELLFPSSILAVKMNRKTLVIVLEVEIYIYDISNMKLLHVIETTPNPNGESIRLRACNSIPTLCSNRRPLSLCRQLLSRIPFTRSLTHARSDLRHTATHTRYAGTIDRGRSPLLHTLSDGRERHPSTQIPHILPLCELYRHDARHRVRQGNSHPRLEHSRLGEALPVPTRDA